MRANDLRLGNLIQKNGKIHYTNIFTIRDIKNLSIDDTDNFEPIPINEDWLLKFGFECIANGGDQKRFGLKNRNKNYFYGVELDHEEICLNKQSLFGCETLIHNEIFLQYVHQLQNLYFALTGSELVFSTEP